MEDVTVKEECQELSESVTQNETKPEREENIILKTNNHGFEEILIKEEPDSNNLIEENFNKEEPDPEDNNKQIKNKNQCPKCGKIFSRLRSMKIHLYAHSEKKTYHCKLCDKLMNKTSEGTHMAIHAGNRVRHECSICHKSYAWKRALNVHLRTHSTDPATCTDQEREKNKCHICGKNFSASGNLNKHLKLVHNKIKDFRCNLCNKSFTEKYSLKYHMTSHVGKKEFECNICHQLFPNINNLQYHLNTHVTNDDGKTKDFPCTLCNKSFTRKESYEYHMNAHKGIKRFQCQTCHKTFSQRTTLNIHSKLHTSSDREDTCTSTRRKIRKEDTKDLECPKCQKSFTVKDYLHKHLKMHLLDDQKTLTCNQMNANSTDSVNDNNLTVENIEDIFVKEDHELISNNKFEETLIKEEPKEISYMDSEDCNNQKENKNNEDDAESKDFLFSKMT